jgi:hypothetical protein
MARFLTKFYLVSLKHTHLDVNLSLYVFSWPSSVTLWLHSFMWQCWRFLVCGGVVWAGCRRVSGKISCSFCIPLFWLWWLQDVDNWRSALIGLQLKGWCWGCELFSKQLPVFCTLGFCCVVCISLGWLPWICWGERLVCCSMHSSWNHENEGTLRACTGSCRPPFHRRRESLGGLSRIWTSLVDQHGGSKSRGMHLFSCMHAISCISFDPALLLHRSA